VLPHDVGTDALPLHYIGSDVVPRNVGSDVVPLHGVALVFEPARRVGSVIPLHDVGSVVVRLHDVESLVPLHDGAGSSMVPLESIGHSERGEELTAFKGLDHGAAAGLGAVLQADLLAAEVEMLRRRPAFSCSKFV